MAFHIALLGDSIFDNRSYTHGEPDVVAHLRSFLPGDWRASLFAVDGSVSEDLAEQFNDVILRVAFEHHLPVIDLRLICNEPADYANPIEPSGRGGRKIALAIARATGVGTETVRSSCVYS